MKKKIIVLQSKYHGSNQQLLSIAKYAFSDYEPHAVNVELRSRKKIFFPLYKVIIFLRSYIGSKKIIAQFLNTLALKNLGPEISDSDVILAKTAPYEVPAQLLAAGSKASVCFIGRPRRFPADKFTCLVSTPSTPVQPNNITLETLPTFSTFKDYELHKINIKESSKIWGMLLGGNAKGFEYDEKTWLTLATDMQKLAKKYKIKWLISTSPRTGKKAEMIFKKVFPNLSPELYELICWGDQQRKSILDCLSSSEVVFVTEDSASMVSEAVNCRIPTISIRPKKTGYNSLTEPLATYHHQKGTLVRMTSDEIGSFDFPLWIRKGYKPLTLCWTEQWRKQVQEK
ncbi:fission ELM1 [Desulfuromusa kysingii]|uniref:Fission ELM1 n=1 Tax=Desulfuromusa kysingii TaxID=37625 RepID=A0A1H3YGA2_9BACT|nr:ELM1/GtrOC1 family putative glycosyltransferase [Desulfuromusa kysingii]SEA10610.1 fission ELM1 [Desulfuromusa kysingii]